MYDGREVQLDNFNNHWLLHDSFKYLFVSMGRFVLVVFVCAVVHMWRTEDNFWELVFYFYSVRSED